MTGGNYQHYSGACILYIHRISDVCFMFLLRRAIGMLTRKFRQIIASCHRIYDLVSTLPRIL